MKELCDQQNEEAKKPRKILPHEDAPLKEGPNKDYIDTGVNFMNVERKDIAS